MSVGTVYVTNKNLELSVFENAEADYQFGEGYGFVRVISEGVDVTIFNWDDVLRVSAVPYDRTVPETDE